MPYTMSNAPEKIKGMPKHAQEIWIAAFNAALKEYDDEVRANQTAYAAVKKSGYSQDDKGEWHKQNAITELWEQIKRIFEPHLPEHTEYLPTETRAFVITRTADGVPRWLMIAASAVVNRVNAIDSTTLFDNFIKHARDSGEYPILDFLHQESAVRFGVADWLARDGALYLASGIFDDTELARSAMAGLESDPAYWGASISYNVTSQPLLLVGEGQIPVYQDGVNNYISIVPKRMAANLFTAATVAEEVIRMDKKTFEELVRLVGPAAAQQFADQVDDANRTITETGMVTRAADETVESITSIETATESYACVSGVTISANGVITNPAFQPTTTIPIEQRQEPVAEEPPAETAAPTPTLEELAAMVKALIAQVQELKAGYSEVEETARAAREADQKRATTALTELSERLVKVEASKQRWDDWLNDAPEHIKQAADLVRARDQPEAPMTMAQLAAMNTAKLNRGPHNSRQH